MVIEQTTFPDKITKSCKLHQQPNTIALFLLFFFLLLLGYHNSFNASWHFDDIANILLNTPLHIDNLSPASLKQTFFAYPDQAGKLLRPISNLTFSLNWYFGQDKVFGYHVINFLIHFITTIALYQVSLLLLSTPRLHSTYRQSKFFIAALAAILWAINPMQTQAITYIVQRMASLATLFYLSGLLFYLKARLQSRGRWQARLYALGTCLAFILAIGSKENAVLFPASIFFIELCFFPKSIRFNKKTFLYVLSGLTLIFIFTLFLGGSDFFQKLYNAYETRDFTLGQRVFTEARIVVFYISLLLYPSPFRLSINHDVLLSSSLFSPFTTLPAVLILISLTVFPFIFYKRCPLLSFAIGFFLLNHIVESTIIPLEILFEHRNYLPSLFLFLPLTAAIGTITEKHRNSSRMLYITTNAGIIAVIILLVLGTIARNSVWQTEKSLWTDSLEKSPLSARSYINLSHSYLFQDNNYQKAFQLSYISLDKQSPTPWKDRLRANNIMAQTMTQTGNYKQAIIFLDKALSFSKANPQGTLNSETLFLKVKTLWLAGQTDMAMETMAELVNASPETEHFLRMYGEMLVAIDKKPEGIAVFARALTHSTRENKEYGRALLGLSITYSQMESFPKADFFYNLAKLHNTSSIPSNLCLLEISIRADETEKAEFALRSLLSQLTWPGLRAILKGTSLEQPTLPLTYPLLQHYADEWLANQKKQ